MKWKREVSDGIKSYTSGRFLIRELYDGLTGYDCFRDGFILNPCEPIETLREAKEFCVEHERYN